MPSARSIPDLSSFMEKRVLVKLHAGRNVSGILRGVDQNMNVVLYDAQDESRYGEGTQLASDAAEGKLALGTTVIRGGTIVEISEQVV